MGPVFRRLLMLPVAMASAPALAPDWAEVTRLDDGTAVSIDRASVTASPPQPYNRDFAVVQVTARYTRADGTVSAISQNSVNCVGRTITALRITHYARDGSVARRWNRLDYDFNYRRVTPNSVGDAIVGTVCAKPRASNTAGG